jgi:hypothetical protein
MARVMVPQMPRRYNHNPRGGSATAVVTMRAQNPFETQLAGPEGLRRVRGMRLAGMGYWGMGDSTDQSGMITDVDFSSVTAPVTAADVSPMSFGLPSSTPAPAFNMLAPAPQPMPSTNLPSYLTPQGQQALAMQTPAAAAATDWSAPSTYGVPLTTPLPITGPATPVPTTGGASILASPGTSPLATTGSSPVSAPNAATAQPTSGGFNWSALTSGLITGAQGVATPFIAAKYGAKTAAAAAAAGKPGAPGVLLPAKPMSSTTKYLLIGGGLLAVGLVVVLAMRKSS